MLPKQMPTPTSEVRLEGRSVAELLEIARAMVDRGDQSKALGAVVRAIRQQCGSAQVLPMLTEAKAFAEAERQKTPLAGVAEKSRLEVLREAISGEGSLLAEEYDDAGDALKQSVRSGESRVCSYCGDVVATARLEAHSKYWCRANGDAGDDTDDEE